MAYTTEEIKISNKIFYHLLKHGELKEGAEELYKIYSENENVTELVKELGEASECYVKKYGGVVYLIPKEDNDFIGYSKGELKKILCKSGANDKDYYLSQFVILTLLVEFYNSQSVTSKSREYIKVGEFLNIITDRLKDGIERSHNNEESGIAYENILERFEALKSSEKKSMSKTTKEGFINAILDFLDSQGLIYYIKGDDMIKTTKKLDSFMDWNLLNKNNYNRVLKALGEEINE
ncbi:hypothetical protein CPAST_c30560 [Clostridium pasteurianum DSM 525 = ATCC 6013]|uniref:Uncharacterized protein n=1 Tax=Clostridium pasteurianum DSM 525 = ATCC 6013 TaxID=1262449 RepID=A0A0H3J7F8_CLOPA|nr:DUF6063 family protein [Clostridium pasteurianum]AJA49122.1 hypothetical protein CPAST_c30560 [Clostridium pasteurianum DSM 525 = ATCC 6013]AJA53110.1 hypothetical protein CLPA_c30560 [Clostridium pasteurianum DSM 525 = ATCC 6013]AOZ76316.1 hypothetical protein AQ983_14850 [Clostridium pasteurianum DSM 525 = ATCC 6013]AOZ80113.1 hypothetical protein AQ984_14845 [Clostridium pasteurianum]ELP59056.1 hypothetical protein F502_11231 [Clostridium pasteurianum DSM 525 = ATCC 6013]